METVLLIALYVALLLLVPVLRGVLSRRDDALRRTLLSAVEQSEARITERLDDAPEPEDPPAPDLTPVLDRLKPLADRLAALEARVEDVARELDAPGLDEQIKPYIAEAMETVEDMLRELRDELDRDDPDPAPAPVPAAAPDSEGATEYLVRRGYTRIRLLDGPTDGEGGIRIPVEAMRDGMTYKGHVIVVDGRVEECSLTPAYRMFP